MEGAGGTDAVDVDVEKVESKLVEDCVVVGGRSAGSCVGDIGALWPVDV